MDTTRKTFFLEQLNDLEVAVTYVRNDYLHRFTKEKIYIVSGIVFLNGKVR